MKFNKDEKVEYYDENRVDFSRKRKLHTYYAVSGRYTRFSPEDPMVDTNMGELNPSVNQKAYNVSNYFNDELNDKSHLLNKGKRRNSRIRRRLRDGLNLDD